MNLKYCLCFSSLGAISPLWVPKSKLKKPALIPALLGNTSARSCWWGMATLLTLRMAEITMSAVHGGALSLVTFYPVPKSVAGRRWPMRRRVNRRTMPSLYFGSAAVALFVILVDCKMHHVL